MAKKRSAHLISVLFFIWGVMAFVFHLIENDWEFTGNYGMLCMIFAYCVYLHFRVAHLEKGADQFQ
jgi:hypothetical protein